MSLNELLFLTCTWFFIALTIASYIYLIIYFIKEKIYINVSLFDILILISGPIGLFIIFIICIINYDDKQ